MPPKPHLFVRSLLCFLPRGKTAEGADISRDLFKGDSHVRHPQRKEVENNWDKRVQWSPLVRATDDDVRSKWI